MCVVSTLLIGHGCRKQKNLVSFNVTNSIPLLPDVTGKKVTVVMIKTESSDPDFEGMNWTFSRKFSDYDVSVAKTSVAFIENLTGLKYHVDYRNMYWSDDMLTSTPKLGSLFGMTVFHEYRDPWRAYIAISTSLNPPSIRDLNALRDFGTTVIHECLHAGNLDLEATVRAKIERPIDMSFDLYCSMTVSNFYAFKLDRFTNRPYSKMIEKVAYDTGIKAPWHYTRDYMGDPIRPIIQIFMAPPTNTVRLGPTNN